MRWFFAFILIKKEKGVYFLENYHLGKVTFDDIYNFASFSGIVNGHSEYISNFSLLKNNHG
jgi:hypothetical protein